MSRKNWGEDMSKGHKYNGTGFEHFSKPFKDKMITWDKQHNDTPNGRNFATWNHPHFVNDQRKYREGFDSIFPDAPGVGI